MAAVDGAPLPKKPRPAVAAAAVSELADDGAEALRLRVPVAARAQLHYSMPPPESKRVGRYINCEDAGELVDVHDVHEVALGDARALEPAPSLEQFCFELFSRPTKVQSFQDEEEIRRVYYPEMEALLQEATGAEKVVLFDHTVRDGAAGSKLNAGVGEAAAAVIRVHTDYSDASGPRRVQTLAEHGSSTGVKFSEEEKEDILTREFCIVNVWRNIRSEPVQSKPLAVLDPTSLKREDFLTYEMQYPERKGENYALRHSPAHRWYFFPLMAKDECLVFKTWESRADRPRYCFHTAFESLDQPPDAPPRSSIEIRAVAIMPRRTPAS